MTDTQAVTLRDRVAGLDREIALLKSEKGRLESESKRLASEAAGAAIRLADAERRHQAKFEGVLTDFGTVRSQLSTAGTGLILNPPPSTPPLDRVERARAEIRALSTIRPRAVAQAPLPPATSDRVGQTRDLMQMKEKMAAKLETPNYDVEVYPDKEFIRGRQGRYYVVDLKNAASGIR